MFVKATRKKPSAAWLATFADLASLLITFFVLLFSMKDIDLERFEEISGALSGALAFTPVEDVQFVGGETDKASFAQANQLTYLQAILHQRFQDDSILKEAALIYDKKEKTLTVQIPSFLLFDVGDAQLKPSGAKAVGKLGGILQHLDNGIMVGGHTDPTPLEDGSSYETNWELSMARAIGVLKKLRSSGVVAPMQALGFADSRLAMLDSKQPLDQRYAKARRVDIVIDQTATNTEKAR